MQTLSSISSIKNFNKHVPTDRFHFKHETRIKERFNELSLQEITFRSDNKLPCSVIKQLQNCDVH
jgi:hypothetical protein